MKTCSIENCDSPVFSHGYCAYHNRMYNAKPLKKVPYKIAKYSKKREAHAKEYTRKITVTNAIPNQLCFFCGKIIYSGIQNHHLLGRIEDKLLDDDLLVPCHGTCHLDFHQKSVHILCHRLWWTSFMDRLRVKSEEAYNKIMNKFDK